MKSRGRASSQHAQLRKLEERWVGDGGRGGHQPYEPMLDKHLFFYFANENRLRLLHKQQIINRKFRIIDPHLLKVIRNKARQHQQAQSFYETLQRLKFRNKFKDQMRLKRIDKPQPNRVSLPSKGRLPRAASHCNTANELEDFERKVLMEG